MVSPADPLPGAPTLAYEAGPTVAAVRPGYRRVVVPPAHWRAVLSTGFVVGLSVAGLFVFVPLLQMVAGNVDLAAAFGAVAEASAAAGVLACVVIERTHRRLAFEVTPEAFRVVFAGPFGVRRAAWPRSAVRDVSANGVTGGLVLRVTGQDPLEYFVGPGRALEIVADLTAAMSLVPPVPPGQQIVGPDPNAGFAASPMRTAVVATAGFAAVAAVGFFFLVPRYAGFACPVLFAAAVSVGLVMGTQRKDYFA